MTRKRIPTTYQEAREMLNGRFERTIANNTTLVDLGSAFGPGVKEIGLRLHSTYVVRWFGDGSMILSTGGWHTVTTKDRINRVIHAHGWGISSVKRVWKIARHGDWKNAEDFHDGRALAPAWSAAYEASR